ncbi:hypothetical protein [Micropruina sp.]|uniref:hypothetical protein n=1 Tax=Micropruina sp. TaxID=2737536 RepID=UPI0039E6A471
MALLQFDNLTVVSDPDAPGGRALVRIRPGEASLVLKLPPQHFMEPSFQTYDEASLPADASTLATFAAPAVPLVAAGAWARFQFVPEEAVDRWPLPSGGLLDLLAGWTPQQGNTMIGVLANLTLTMGPDEWQFSVTPGAAATPVWHARLRTASVVTGLAVPPGRFPERIQAVAFPRPGQEPRQITVSGVLYHPFPYAPRASFLVRRLIATPLGGSVDLAGPVSDDAAFAYEHRTALGRDARIRRTVSGTLSTGHRANITVTAARVIRARPPGITATLTDTTELTVLEHTVQFDSWPGAPDGGRTMPWRTLTLQLDRLTINSASLTEASWLTTASGSLLADLVAMDRSGRVASLRMPLAFLPDGADPAGLVRLLGDGAWAVAQPTAVALGTSPDDSAADTVTVTGAAFGLAATGNPTRPVVPYLRQLSIALDALAGLGGEAPIVTAGFDAAFVAAGFDPVANPAGQLLAMEPTSLRLPTGATGGLGNPGGNVDLLTTRDGLVSSAVAGLTPDQAPAREVLERAFPSPKLFGSINLLDLIATLPSTPQLSRTGPAGQEVVRYTFQARLQSSSQLGIRAAADALLSLTGTVALTAGGIRPPRTSGTVTGLTFDLAGLVDITFPKLDFSSDENGRTTMSLGAGLVVAFKKELEFLQDIANTLAGLGQGSGTRVDIDAGGVTAGFQLQLPTLAMGLVQISNLSISALVRIPFTAEPMTFRLEVARRDRPFLATVSMFGGGGWLALELGPDGLRSLDAGIEFGGSMELDIVVASGGISVMAGAHFGLKQGGKELTFEAYLRASGHLSVLGIVTLYVEFYLQLGYRKQNGQGILYGTASVTVGVRVLFFSKAVTLSISREFAGSAADPSFLDCLEPDDWDAYCAGFAPEALP